MAWVPLNVNADVSGVVLALDIGGALNGHLRAEGKTSFDFVRVQLKNATGVLLPQGFELQPGLVGVDGNFRIDNVPTGDHHLSSTGMPEGFYLKEARIGDTDVLNAPLRY
jgi:hypothetical protein